MASFCNGSRGKPGCGKPIIWAEVYTTQRRMPLDADTVEPFTPGSFAVRPQPGGGHTAMPAASAVEIVSRVAAVSEKQAEKLLREDDWHLSHFATCPHADAHRRR